MVLCASVRRTRGLPPQERILVLRQKSFYCCCAGMCASGPAMGAPCCAPKTEAVDPGLLVAAAWPAPIPAAKGDTPMDGGDATGTAAGPCSCMPMPCCICSICIAYCIPARKLIPSGDGGIPAPGLSVAARGAIALPGCGCGADTVSGTLLSDCDRGAAPGANASAGIGFAPVRRGARFGLFEKVGCGGALSAKGTLEWMKWQSPPRLHSRLNW
mmetsp:Transcript_37717/g.116547  ORF Transcript_37717/g.116547 Transcript_37717/m.116547 type:complete len:214 (-) Transcript_37717:2048-2689(-)